MNGINGHAGPPGLWQEARNADGRVYYYNTITKATQWNKPEELMTPAEVRLNSHLISSVSLLTLGLACPSRSAMEGIHCRRRSEVLVQYRDQAELLGDARDLQGSFGKAEYHSTACCCVCSPRTLALHMLT
jgi:hypothetical protein